MLAAREISVPLPHGDDIDEVDCALTVAQARWRSGDRTDALKWVRKAAREAADNDQVLRALELSKAAVALEATMRPVQPPVLHAVGGHAKRPLPSPGLAPARISSRPPPDRSGPHPTGKFLPKRESAKPPPVPERSEPRRKVEPPPRPAEPMPDRNAERSSRPSRDINRTHPILDTPSESNLATLPQGVPRQGYSDLDEPTVSLARKEPPSAVASWAGAGGETTDRSSDAARHLAAMRVAVVRDGATGGATLIPLAEYEPAPDGAATAMLVAATENDSELLARLLGVETS